MYTEHFGLRMLPFVNVSDPALFFDSGEYAGVRNGITGSLKSGQGVTVVTGPAGSGKTTLGRMILSVLSSDTKPIWVDIPPGNCTELFLFIAGELELRPAVTKKVFVIRDIRDALLKKNAEDKKCMLIMDEAHLMSDDTLNGVRILNNFEDGPARLIQLLLLGQEKLMELIKSPGMEAVKPCIFELKGSIEGDRILNYISHRMQAAGGHTSIFSDTGLEALMLAFNSGSTFRVINSFCDQALRAAFERGVSRVDAVDVYQAAKEMELQEAALNCKFFLEQREAKDPDKAQKSLKDQCRTFLRTILGKKERTSGETMKAVPAPLRTDGENANEVAISHMEDDRQAMTDDTSVKLDGLAAKDEKKTRGVDSSVEWLTIDAAGARSFTPFYVRDKKRAEKKGTAAKNDEWVTIDAAGARPFTPVYVKDKERMEKKGTAEPDEWVRINTKKE